MDDIIDLLQIKIEKAKSNLSDDTLNAIASIPWKDIIIGMREKKGYTFEQLGDLELETELLLCGLLNPENYPKELKSRMKISEAQANELVKEMNELVFSKIKEELIKTTERKKMFVKNVPPRLDKEGTGGGNSGFIKSPPHPNPLLTKERGDTLPVPDLPAVPSAQLMQAGKLELKGNVIHPILAQKLSGSIQTPIVKTEHTLENITKPARPIGTVPPVAPASYPKNADPYRLPPE